MGKWERSRRRGESLESLVSMRHGGVGDVVPRCMLLSLHTDLHVAEAALER